MWLMFILDVYLLKINKIVAHILTYSKKYRQNSHSYKLKSYYNSNSCHGVRKTVNKWRVRDIADRWRHIENPLSFQTLWGICRNFLCIPSFYHLKLTTPFTARPHLFIYFRTGFNNRTLFFKIKDHRLNINIIS